MDFIEGIFGIAPDGGSGTFEFLLFALPLAGIIYLLRRRQRAHKRRDLFAIKLSEFGDVSEQRAAHDRKHSNLRCSLAGGGGRNTVQPMRDLFILINTDIDSNAKPSGDFANHCSMDSGVLIHG